MSSVQAEWSDRNGLSVQVRPEYAAIDDRSWLYRPFNRFLFLLDGKTGMTAANAEELIGRPHGM